MVLQVEVAPVERAWGLVSVWFRMASSDGHLANYLEITLC